MNIIPVLLNNASMPVEEDLPDDLRRLARIQAVQLSDARWEYDIGRLLELLGDRAKQRPQTRRRFLAIALPVAVILGAGSLALLWRRSPGIDVTGRWTADVEYEYGGRHSELFEFRQDAGLLGGTASFLGVARTIVEGRLEDDRIIFVTRSEEIAGDETRQVQHHYRGTIAGDEIRFVKLAEGGFSAQRPVEFTAKRAAPSPQDSPRP
jgi:hypothetical protein